MKKIYVAKDPTDAALVKDMLERLGVRATVHGEALWNARGELPLTEDTLPSVWVSAGDVEEAKNAIRTYNETRERDAKSSWLCPDCKEENAGSFEVCWNCATDRSKAKLLRVTKKQTSVEEQNRKRKSSIGSWVLLLFLGLPLVSVGVFKGLEYFFPDGPDEEFRENFGQFVWGEQNHKAFKQFKGGHFSAAVATLSEVIDAGNASVSTYLLRGFIHAHVNNHKSAARDYDRAVTDEPRLPRARILRARHYEETSQLEAARRDRHQASKLLTQLSNRTILDDIDRAEITWKTGSSKEALDLLAALSRKNLEDDAQAMVFRLVGRIQYEAENYEQAARAYSASLEHNSLSDESMQLLGWALLKTGAKNAALTQFNKALRINPRNARALAGRGALSQETNDCENGINDLTNAILLNNQNPLYYFHRAKCYFIGDDLEKADADVRKTIDLNPSYRGKIDFRKQL